MADTVHCTRCARTDAPALDRAPLPGPTGQEILEKVCADCWAEWTKAEVMVINELRLNFMDPKSGEILDRHMREFLALDGEPGSAPAGSFPPGYVPPED